MKAQINRAVEVICKDIQEQDKELSWLALSEADILFELVLSILGSQNKYEVALKFAQSIKQNLLSSYSYKADKESSLIKKLQKILTTPQQVNGNMVKYRFPNTRARYIAKNLIFINSQSGIKTILNTIEDTYELRKYIVINIQGIGPKQASHFLRNIGLSNDIAVLDIHILRYMKIQNVISADIKSISNLKVYETLEKKLIEFLKFIYAPIGLIDQAIWIVMRVYQREYLSGNS